MNSDSHLVREAVDRWHKGEWTWDQMLEKLALDLLLTLLHEMRHVAQHWSGVNIVCEDPNDREHLIWLELDATFFEIWAAHELGYAPDDADLEALFDEAWTESGGDYGKAFDRYKESARDSVEKGWSPLWEGR